MSERACTRCGETIPSSRPRSKYCSDNCAKRACDERNRAVCAACGSYLAPRSGWKNAGRTAPMRCRSCDFENRRAVHDARVERAADLYNAGKSYRAIAAAFGWSESSLPGVLINDARERGLISYRYQVAGLSAAADNINGSTQIGPSGAPTPPGRGPEPSGGPEHG